MQRRLWELFSLDIFKLWLRLLEENSDINRMIGGVEPHKENVHNFCIGDGTSKWDELAFCGQDRLNIVRNGVTGIMGNVIKLLLGNYSSTKCWALEMFLELGLSSKCSVFILYQKLKIFLNHHIKIGKHKCIEFVSSILLGLLRGGRSRHNSIKTSSKKNHLYFFWLKWTMFEWLSLGFVVIMVETIGEIVAIVWWGMKRDRKRG